MGLFDFFKKKKTSQNEENLISSNKITHKLYSGIFVFNNKIDELLKQDKFISRNDYKDLITEYKELYNSLLPIYNNNLISDFSKKYKIKISEINRFSNLYKEIQDLKKESPTIKAHNEEFLQRHLNSEKTYLDTILKDCDSAIMLDEEQRRVILSDEDHTLVIAGAGAGKTTTIAAKVKYLTEKQNIKPSQILVISFTNKAVDELKNRINHNLQIPAIISTFHSVGYSILRQSETEQKRVVEGGFMYNIINNYLKTKIIKDSTIVNKLILFFASYISAPCEINNTNEYLKFLANSDFSTLKSNLKQTLRNENLRSAEEVMIANFLYMNQIEYEYEPIYQYRVLDSRKPYTPDFIIKQGEKTTYIEHFGITEEGQNSRYTQEELEKYKTFVNNKIKLHRKHKTDLIYTFSKYKDNRPTLVHLEEELLKRGYELKKRNSVEVYQQLIDIQENKYITKLTWFICTFISNFKTQGYTLQKFSEFKQKINNPRTQLFLEICEVCYLEYQKNLKEQNCIDFQDMINNSAQIIKNKQLSKEKIDFKYIIVDEYQDISRQRYNLIKELSQLCNAKIMAVGDDWQSIYAFSGSVLTLFTQFCKEVGYGTELKITKTYRNAQEIINIAGNFIQKNSKQIKKALISPKRIENPVYIQSYEDKFSSNKNKAKGGIYDNIGAAINEAIAQIIKYNSVENKNNIPSILLIGRYGFDARNMCKSNQFSYDEKSGNVFSSKYGAKVKLNFMTAHSSKGLSAENVIIINAKDNIYGFPSKVEDDPILKLVVSYDDSYNYAEERRLFYVALTRTKNRVFIITPKHKPSEFIKELLNEPHNYPNVTLNGELSSLTTDNDEIKNRCPKCGYPMQLKWNKNYGLKLWICTNDQEICGFMTNDKREKELSIHKCDWCKDGYLVVKNNKNHYFLGCTNYKADNSGCNRSINKTQYKFWQNDNFGVIDESEQKQSYAQEKKSEPQTNSQPIAERIPQTINEISYKDIYLNNQVIKIAVDSFDNLLTDLTLFDKLYRYKNKYKKENAPVLTNQILVQLSTNRPTTYEEIMDIHGFGEKYWEYYGREILMIIITHLSKA
ncbi:MAG: UvrD-helicase domain-containing protein [Bacteroidales bacterium]|nr:UvrD-helicase domain-containing protein [Bacteroidales bacterium]